MIIRINKDMGSYKKSVWKGLDVREIKYSICTVVVTLSMVLSLYYIVGLPFEYGIYITLPITALIGACGFVSINGMYFQEIAKKYYNVMFRGNLIYQSTEEINFDMNNKMIQTEQKKKGQKEKLKAAGSDSSAENKMVNKKKKKSGAGLKEILFSPQDCFRVCKKVSDPLYKTPKAIQELFEVEHVAENGIFKLREGQYSKAYFFADINYANKNDDEQEETFTEYCSFLNSIKVLYKLLIINKERSIKELEEELLYKMENDGLDNMRKAYNDLILARTAEGRQGIKQEKCFLVMVERKSMEDAKAYFNSLEASLSAYFRKMGSSIVPLNGNQRLKLLADALFLSRDEEFDLAELSQNKRDWKNDMGCARTEFHQNNFFTGGLHQRALFIKKFPTSLDDKFLTELTDLPVKMLCAVDIAPIPKEVTVKELDGQHDLVETKIQKEQQRKTKYGVYTSDISWHRKQEREEIEEMMDEIRQNDEKMFYAGFTIVIATSSKEELDTYTESVKMIAEGYSVQVEEHWLNQKEAWMTALPLGLHYVKTMRTLLTQSLAAFMPFNVQECFDKKGTFKGVNRVSKAPLSVDQRKLENGGGFIFGGSGSGKSVESKSDYIQRYLRNIESDRFVVLDPQSESKKLIKQIGGTYIDLNPFSEVHINPFQVMEGMSKEEAIYVKSEFAMALCEQALEKELTPFHKSIIDRCIGKMFERYFQTGQEKTLIDFRRLLLEQDGEAANELAACLEIFTTGSLKSFTYKTNVDCRNRMVGVGLQGLGDQLRKIGILVVLEFITNSTNLNYQKSWNTWVYMDEFHIIMDRPYSIQYLIHYWKTVRKLGGFPRGITQNPIDVAKNDDMKSLIANSDYIVCMKLSPSDRALIQELKDFSATDLEKYVKDSERGCGLLKAGNRVVPFDNVIPKDSLLFELFQTDHKVAM